MPGPTGDSRQPLRHSTSSVAEPRPLPDPSGPAWSNWPACHHSAGAWKGPSTWPDSTTGNQHQPTSANINQVNDRKWNHCNHHEYPLKSPNAVLTAWLWYTCHDQAMIEIAAAAAPEKSSSDSHHGRIHPRYSQWPVPPWLPRPESGTMTQRWHSAEAKAFRKQHESFTASHYDEKLYHCDIMYYIKWYIILFHVIWCYVMLYIVVSCKKMIKYSDQQSSAWRSSHTHLRGQRGRQVAAVAGVLPTNWTFFSKREPP